MLRARMRTAHHYRVPLSAFLSWGEADQAMALAYQQYLDETCSGCGVHPDVWTPEALNSVRRHRVWCPGCAVLEAPMSDVERRPGMKHRLMLTASSALATLTRRSGGKH